jgi:hypothetical protein
MQEPKQEENKGDQSPGHGLLSSLGRTDAFFGMALGMSAMTCL